MTPPLDLQELKRLAAGATQGEWRSYVSQDMRDHDIFGPIEGQSIIRVINHPNSNDTSHNNTRFITSANPETVKTLISVIEECVGVLEKLAKERHFYDGMGEIGKKELSREALQRIGERVKL